MRLLFLYTFILASGATIDAEMEAVNPQGYKPVRSMQECERLADEQAGRFRQSFAVSDNGMFVDVVIHCEKRRAVRQSRRMKK